MKKVIALSVVFFLSCSLVSGSGFLIYEHGAAAMGMGGAFVSIANDPTAIFYNPAGIAWLSGTQVNVGGTFVFPAGWVNLPNWPDPAYQKVYQLDQTFFPPHFYLTQSLGSRVTVGLGFFAPYGLGTSWPVNYPLRYISTDTSLQTMFINPAIAIKISDHLSLGAGLSYISATLSQSLVQHVVIPDVWEGDIPATMHKAKGDTVGFNAGLLFKKNKFSAGFNWRSGFTVDFSGPLTLDTSRVPSPVQPYIPSSANVALSFKYPNIFGLGFSYQATTRLLLSIEGQYFTWSTYENYVIKIDYPNGSSEEQLVEQNFKDSIILRAGAQYMVKENLALRAGIIYDQAPQPVETMDPSLPDASRVAFTIGFGYTKDRFEVALGYQYEIFSDRTSPNRNIYPDGMGEGKYHTRGQLLGFTFGYKF
ncbi:MAG: outer membrane protein transport protein [Acidobacteriota bacterium]|nr:outer membrane protein transport protein [Acidobacteriota bacterium]